MIDKEKFHVFNYLKKEEYTASMDGMRYMLKKKEGEAGVRLEAVIWPEPYCYAKTEEEKKRRKEFDFTSDGVGEAADWLNGQYEEDKAIWDAAKRNGINL